MERYDVAYCKLDLALGNTNLNVAGSVRMQARNDATPLDTLAFELLPTYPDTDGLAAGLYHLRLIDAQGQVSQARFTRE